DMNAGIAIDAAVLQRARVVAHLDALALHEAVDMIAPGMAHLARRHARRNLPAVFLRFAHVLGAGGGADHFATAVDIGVLEENMHMRVVRILIFVVMRRAPWHAAAAEGLHEAVHGLMTLLGG